MAGVNSQSRNLIPTARIFLLWLALGLLLINLFVAGLAAFSIFESRKQYESRMAIQTQNLSQSVSLTIAGIMDKTGLMLFSVKKEMERQIKSGGIDSRTVGLFIQEQARQIAELEVLRIADSEGNFIFGNKPLAGPGVNIAHRDYFRQARDNPGSGLIVSGPIRALSSDKWIVNLVRPIENPDGTFAGAVVGAISLEYISRVFSSFDLGKDGVLTLRDRDLAVIVRVPEPPGGKTCTGSKAVSRQLAALVKEGKTSGTYRNPGSIDPIPRIFSFNKLSGYPFYVTVGLATSEYLAPWRAEARKMLALVLFFMCGSLAFACFVYGSHKRKLWAEADLMRYREDLEETVCRRTAELEDKNAELAREIALRREADMELRKAAIIMDRMPDAVTWVSREGKYLYVNDAACRMHGYTRDEMLSMSLFRIAPLFSSEDWQPHWEELKREGFLHFETINRRLDGSEFPVEVTANYVIIDGLEYNCAIIRDISDRKEAEVEKQHLLLQLNQAQKMESIGRLAGGIAHDFNNLLMPVLGYAEMLKMHLPAESDDSKKVDSILKAADKARVLTQQLLSFGRKQILQMQTIDLNEVIGHFYEILRRTIRESIEIRQDLPTEVYGIRADRNQIEQILLNLAINAQDAIEDKGVITIETAPVTLDDEYARQHAGVRPGKYLMLAVSDNGSGIDSETIEHIFEPFFTTKAMGKGSGLGLATVYGLVKQHDGYVWVYSEVGKGTVFKVYFPLADDLPVPEEKPVADTVQPPVSDCLILVAEDNEMVRNLVCDALRISGYRIVMAEGPSQALEAAKSHEIQLLVTDVVMPGMNGPELYGKLLEKHKGLKVLFMSGYTNNVIAPHGVLQAGVNFIQKPFAVKDLLVKIETILNGATGEQAV